MSREYIFSDLQRGFGKARELQFPLIHTLQQYFAEETLGYLDEKIINHLLDQIVLMEFFHDFENKFNDFSFLIAPSYKALEGFLFQLADNLKLPSAGNKNLVGSYYVDEEKLDEQIDSLLSEIELRTGKITELNEYEKRDIKSRLKEMKDFLRHYRHSPAHYTGEPIDTVKKAERTIMVIFAAIDNTASILLKAKLISVK